MSHSNGKYLDSTSFIAKYKIPHIKFNHPSVISKTHGVPFEEDDWFSENEEHILDIWHGINNIIDDRGLYILDKCRFHHLCTFIASMSTIECSADYQNFENED